MRPRTFSLTLFLALAVAVTPSADSQLPSQAGPTYADLADLALAAPVAAHVRIRNALLLKPREAPGVPAGFARYYVQADVAALIRAPSGIPARLSYLVDLPRDAKGKAPKLRKGSEFILLASPVPGRPGELRLVAPDGQLAFTPERAAQLRTILGEATGASPPPPIAGIGRAFHVPGAIPGESETQFFLLAADGRPVSMTVLRRPGQTPQWAVALSEIVDDAAAAPARDTLLWYRLACSLPRALPRQSLTEAQPEHVAAIQADYKLILDRLGPCGRTRRG
jgi:hypothetical protein